MEHKDQKQQWKPNITYEKAYAFALNIVEVCKIMNADREFILSKQLLKSGTSIGANVAEANGAISEADFSAKISIAYKEALETKYWLNLLHDSKLLATKTFAPMLKQCDELCRILFSILKKTRINKKAISNS